MIINHITRLITSGLGVIGRHFKLTNTPFLQKPYQVMAGLMLPGHEVVVDIDGQKMTVPNPRQSILGKMLYLYGAWEPPVSHFLRSKLQPGMIVLDVGAHAGYYTLLMAKQVGKDGKVIAFEPNRLVRELLLKNIKLNEYDYVTVSPFALFSREGTTVLETLDSSNMRLSLDSAASNKEQVVMREFDRCTIELGVDRVDLIKIDVEGAEFDVLQGMRELLDKHHPALLIEVHFEGLTQFGHTSPELLDFVRSFGYVIEPIWSQDGTDTIFCKVT